MLYWAFKHPCCTCEHWYGECTVQTDPRVLECSAGAMGACYGPNKANRGKKLAAGTYVGDWKKCYELRRGMRS